MPKKRYPDETWEQAAELREAGLSYGQIARKLDVSESSVYWHCLRLGADAPQVETSLPRWRGPMECQRGRHVVRRFTEAEDRQLLELERAGLPLSEVARQLGRRHNSITGRLMTLARREARVEARQMAGE